jgi:ankyrin repeat protein
MVKLLIQLGANIQAYDNNDLIFAATNGYFDVVKLLLRYDVEIHANDVMFEWVAGNSHIEASKISFEYNTRNT